MRLVWLSVIFSAWALAQTVEGTVVNGLSGRGMPNVGIELRPTFEASNYESDTDEQGHFVIEGLKPGTYRFLYKAENYWSTDPAYPATFQVGGPGGVGKLEGRMLPRPRISGRVLDAKGEGVSHARVTAVGPLNPSVSTGEDGGFDLALSPGAYMLTVAPPADLKAPDPEPETGHPRAWRRTFYPGVARMQEALKIGLSPGDYVSGLEIKLLTTPTYTVRGVLLNRDGHPAPDVQIAMGSTPRWAEYHAKTDGEGEFEFGGVIDGEWVVAAELASEQVKLRAIEFVEVAGRDPAALKVRLEAPIEVRGKVVLEGADRTSELSPAPNWSWLALVRKPNHDEANPGMLNRGLNPELLYDRPVIVSKGIMAYRMSTFGMLNRAYFTEAGGSIASPDAEGNFMVKDVYPGRYWIVGVAPHPYYLAAAPEIDLSTGSLAVTLVYKSEGGSVHGRAEKCGSGPVLLIPQDARLRVAGLLRRAFCDAQSHFEIGSVRPGDYYVVALAGSGDVPQLNEEILRRADRIAVRAGESATVDLKAMARAGN